MAGAEDTPKPRRNRPTRLGEMYKAIGIEDDDNSSDNSNDEEFVVDAEESDSASDSTDTTPESALKGIKKSTKGNKGNESKPVRVSVDGSFKTNQVLNDQSPNVLPTEHPRKKHKVTNKPDRPQNIPIRSTAASKRATSPEYNPRKRSSQHLDELELEDHGDDEIVNVVPSFASKESFSSWDDFEKHFY